MVEDLHGESPQLTLLVVLEQERPVLGRDGRVDRLRLDGIVHLLIVDRGHFGGCRRNSRDQILFEEIFGVRQLQCQMRLAPT